MKTISLIAALAFGLGCAGYKAQAYDGDDHDRGWRGHRDHEWREYRPHECHYLWIEGHRAWCHHELIWIPGHYERIW
jgi:hypothetical protein